VKDTNSVVELMEQCNDIYRHFSNHFMTCSLPESAKQQSQYQSTITELHHHLLSETREQPWLYDSQVFSCDAKTSWVSECVREKFFRASTRRQLPFYVGFQVDIDVEGWTPLPDDSLRIDCRVTFESASTFVRYLLN
jgi:GTPase Era involved in 16S rRNA processing